MRRSLRDNESIPIPLEWNIMKFVAQIDKRRRKQFGYSDPVGQTTSRGRGRKKVILVFLRRNLKIFFSQPQRKDVSLRRNAPHQRNERNPIQIRIWKILSRQMINLRKRFFLIQRVTRKSQRVSV